MVKFLQSGVLRSALGLVSVGAFGLGGFSIMPDVSDVYAPSPGLAAIQQKAPERKKIGAKKVVIHTTADLIECQVPDEEKSGNKIVEGFKSLISIVSLGMLF